MKHFLLAVSFLCCITSSFSQNQNVGIGTTTPDASSILDLKANNKGFLAPRLTSAQRSALSNPAEGLLVYDVTFECFYVFKRTQGLISMCGGGQGGNPGPTGSTGIPGENGFDGATG